jgi:hypothetical protein
LDSTSKAPRLFDRLAVPPWLPRVAQTVPFRLAVVVVALAVHLAAIVILGQERFGLPFNRAPHEAPHLVHPNDVAPKQWDRLIVSRWDSGHYLSIATRGYSMCPKEGFPTANFAPYQWTCDLAFFPTYPWIGWLASFGGRVALDYTLWIVSLVCSAIFLFLWTGPPIVERMGLGPTWVSFLMLNGFTTAYCLVTVQTEPLALVLTLGALVALMRKRYLLGALVAGAATAVRVTAVSTGVAYGLALVAVTVAEWPLTGRALARRVLEMVLSGWGILALLIYYGLRFHDPFIYSHAHAATHGHHPSLARLFPPDVDQVAMAIDHPMHEGIWLAAGLLWFGLGHKEAMSRFSRPERIFCYALFVMCVGVACYGTADLAFQGMNRYLLLCIPLFFAMAATTARRPFVLVLWLLLGTWHYWNIDLCEYAGGPGNNTLNQCHAQHWIGRI